MAGAPDPDKPDQKKNPFHYTYEDITGPGGPQKRRQIRLISGGIHLALLAGVFAAAAAFGALDGQSDQPAPPPPPHSAPLQP